MLSYLFGRNDNFFREDGGSDEERFKRALDSSDDNDSEQEEDEDKSVNDIVRDLEEVDEEGYDEDDERVFSSAEESVNEEEEEHEEVDAGLEHMGEEEEEEEIISNENETTETEAGGEDDPAKPLKRGIQNGNDNDNVESKDSGQVEVYKGKAIDEMSYRTLQTHLKQLKAGAKGKTSELRLRLKKVISDQEKMKSEADDVTSKAPQHTPIAKLSAASESIASGTRSAMKKKHGPAGKQPPEEYSSSSVNDQESPSARKRSTKTLRLAAAKSPKKSEVNSSRTKSKSRSAVKKSPLNKKSSTVDNKVKNLHSVSDVNKKELEDEAPARSENTSVFNGNNGSNCDLEGKFNGTNKIFSGLDNEVENSNQNEKNLEADVPAPITNVSSAATASNDNNSDLEGYFNSEGSRASSDMRSDQITPLPNSVEMNIAAASDALDKKRVVLGSSSSSATSVDQPDDDNVSITATIGSTSSPLTVPSRTQNKPSSSKKTSFVDMKNSPVAPLPVAATLDSLVGQRFMNVLNDEGPQLTEKEYLFFKSFLDKKKPMQHNSQGRQDESRESEESFSRGGYQSNASPSYVEQSAQNGSSSKENINHNNPRNFDHTRRVSYESSFQYPPPHQHYEAFAALPFQNQYAMSPQLSYQYPPYATRENEHSFSNRKRDISNVNADYGMNESGPHDESSFIAPQYKRRHIDSSYQHSGMFVGSAPMFDMRTQSSPEMEKRQEQKSPIVQSQLSQRKVDVSSHSHTPRFRENVGSFFDSNRRSSASSALSNIQKRRMKRRQMGSNASTSTSASSSPRVHSTAPSGAIAKRILDTLGVLTSSLDDHRQMQVPSEDINRVQGRESGKTKAVQFENSNVAHPESVSDKRQRKVYATTPYRSAAFYANSSASSKSVEDNWSLKNSSEKSKDEDRRESLSSTSGELWSREQGESRKSSLSPVAPAISKPQIPMKSKHESPMLDAPENEEYTFDSPTVCIEGLQEETVSGVKKRHSISQSRRSTINFAFSPPGKRRCASEVKKDVKIPKMSFSSPGGASAASGAQSLDKATEKSEPPSFKKSNGAESTVSEASAVKAPPSTAWAQAIAAHRCTHCKVPVSKDATKCPACEGSLQPASSSTQAKEVAQPKASPWPQASAANTSQCPQCKCYNEKGSQKCKVCEASLEESGKSSQDSSMKPSFGSLPSKESFSGKFSFGASSSTSVAITKDSSTKEKSSQEQPQPFKSSASGIASSSVKPASSQFGFLSAPKSDSTAPSEKSSLLTFGLGSSASSAPTNAAAPSTKSGFSFSSLSKSSETSKPTESPSADNAAAALDSSKDRSGDPTSTGPAFTFGSSATTMPKESAAGASSTDKPDEKKPSSSFSFSSSLGGSKPQESCAPSFGQSTFKTSESAVKDDKPEEDGAKTAVGTSSGTPDVSTNSTTTSTAPKVSFLNSSSTPSSAEKGETSSKRPMFTFKGASDTIDAAKKVGPAPFKFGGSSTAASSDATKKVDPAPFKFGGSSTAASSDATKKVDPAPFKFGGSSIAAASSDATKKVDPAPFKFGGSSIAAASSDATKKVDPAPFKFGGSSIAAASSDATKKVDPAPFKFGESSTAAASSDATKKVDPASFKFGASNTNSESSSKSTTPSFKFGSKPPTEPKQDSKAPTFLFGQSAPSTSSASFPTRSSTPPSSSAQNQVGVDSPGSTMDMGYASGDVSDSANTLPPPSNNFSGFGSSAPTFQFGQSGGNPAKPAFGVASTSTNTATKSSGFNPDNSASSGGFGGFGNPQSNNTSKSFQFASNSNFNAGAFGSSSAVQSQSASAPNFSQSNTFSAPFSGSSANLSSNSLAGNASGGFSIGATDKRRKVKAKRPNR